MKAALLQLWARLFARPRFVRLNRFLYTASLRGLGVLNFGSMQESGEHHFLERLLAVYRSNSVQPVVLDVGANVGNYAREILAIERQVSIHCFEPHPANVAKLRQAVGSSVNVVPCAVGADAGVLDLFDYADEDGSSHASVYKEVFEKIHKRRHGSHPVDVVTIDDFLEREKIDRVALLKIDTEGHELSVLSGASMALASGRIDVVHFEFNEMNIASRTFIGDFFQALSGFQFFRLLPRGWLPVHDRPLENIFAFQNIIAIRDGSRAHAALI